MKSAQCGRGGGGGRIVGGREVQRGEHPSIVSLKFGGGHICGGTLISEEWVLTAAHCVNDYRARTISVTIREHNVLEPEYPIDAYTVKPSKIIVHEHYADEGMNVTQANDIALIKLSSPIRLEGDEFAAAACLPDNDSETFTGQNASAVGWGRAAEDPNVTPPPILQQVILPVISNQECSSLLAGIFKIGRGQMCAGFREGGKDACQGDSGGPLYVRKGRIDYLVGITSFGEGCARPDLPGVYARTSYYLNWIRHNMNTN
ncbi:unnamed protein product [Cyprideis torosa]|uniref:Uncharacterized protein n=1 Tax=Cyprideis torosa TaxID=163714 RepID=A0A7R8ZPZ5_9CRUS|nr:unnamed protein product [Cyprideis torosa]CAG0901759.1 unnamed protein product [Cyprideis torosa]